MFLKVDASNRLRSSCEKSKMDANYTGNCTKREWAWRQVVFFLLLLILFMTFPHLFSFTLLSNWVVYCLQLFLRWTGVLLFVFVYFPVVRRCFNFHGLSSSVLLYLVVQLRLGCVLLSADISQVDNLHERLSNVSTVLQDIGPVWYFVDIWYSWFSKFCIFRKNEFISLYNFLPWYALANVLLIVGGIKVQNIHSILTTRKTCSSTF